MIPNDALINALRGLGYHYKDQSLRMLIYKKAGSAARVMFRRTSMHDEGAARSVLKMAGMPPDEIQSFISTYKSASH